MSTSLPGLHWDYQNQMKKDDSGTVASFAESGGSSPFKVTSSRQMTAGKPALTDEAMGWLAYLNRRTDFGGTWTKDDAPHLSWDNLTNPPVGNFLRYDLTYLCWAVGIMADQTPAWREVYSKVLDYAAQRFLEYWSLFDWIERRGADPDMAHYEEFWNALLIPAGQVGKYSVAGWASNGIEPFEYDPDPVRANGQCNAMYKGYLNTVLGLYTYVSGSDKYDQPFKVTYDNELVFEYDYVSLNELIADQMFNTPAGLSCEVTKAYGYCNNLTGLGLRLFDMFHATQHEQAYNVFKRRLRENYMSNGTGTGPIDKYTLIYDAGLDLHMQEEEHQLAYNWVGTAWNGLPLDSELHTRLYEGAIKRFYNPQPDGSAFLVGLPGMGIADPYATLMATSVSKEMGDDERHASLRLWTQRNLQPTWDTTRGEFFFHHALNETWPRAQHNEWLMPGYTITAPGQWRGLFNKPNLTKFREPTVEGVDYPTVRPRQAYWCNQEKALFVAITTCDEGKIGEPTGFRVTNLNAGATYRLTIDGQVQGADRRPENGELRIETNVGTHNIVLQQL